MGREGDAGSPRGGSGETSFSPVCPLKQFCIFLQAHRLIPRTPISCLSEAPDYQLASCQTPGYNLFLPAGGKSIRTITTANVDQVLWACARHSLLDATLRAVTHFPGRGLWTLTEFAGGMASTRPKRDCPRRP